MMSFRSRMHKESTPLPSPPWQGGGTPSRSLQAGATTSPRCKGGATAGFTLVELIVVIGILAILMIVGLPGVSRMLEDTRRADTETRIKGLLTSARARALDNRTTGLFFYVDSGSEAQKAVFIEEYPDGAEDESITVDRFIVIPGQMPTVFEKPFRVVPRHVLDPKSGATAGPPWRWSNEELANNDYQKLTLNTDASNTPDNHRNFFTLLFSTDGKLVIKDQVYICDGDRIGDDPGGNDPPTQQPSDREPGSVTGIEWVRNAGKFQDAMGLRIGAWGPVGANPAMIVDNTMVPSDPYAINFPSVDGLLVYDDAAFSGYPIEGYGSEPVRRDYLIQYGRPYYVATQTGRVIAGPVGEAVEPSS